MAVPQIDLHCQGEAYHNGTSWLMPGSLLKQLALVFALRRSESDELEARPGASDDLRVAPRYQHLKPGTHLPPDFPRIFVARTGTVNSPMVLQVPYGDRKSVV